MTTRTRYRIALGAATVLAMVLAGRWLAASPDEPPEFAPEPSTVVRGFSFQNATLDDALAVLREKTRANIVVDWSQLDPKLRTDTASLSVGDVPLEKALDVVLALYAPEGGQRLAHVANDGVTYVVRDARSPAQGGAPTVTVLYDVRDFEHRFLRPTNPTPLDGSNPYDEPPGHFPPPGVALPAAERLRRAVIDRKRVTDTLMEQIDVFIRFAEETVDPNSWRDNGGTVGSVRELEGLLIVEQTPENQERFQKLLRNLRRYRDDIDRGRPPPDGPVDPLHD